MIRTRSHHAMTSLIALALLLSTNAGTGYLQTRLAAAENKKDKVVVLETDLVADDPALIDRNGIVHSPFVLDPHLVNHGVSRRGRPRPSGLPTITPEYRLSTGCRAPAVRRSA